MREGKSIGLFVAYVVAWAVHGVLVHHAGRTSSLPLTTGSIVMLQDLLKLVVSVALFRVSEGSFSILLRTLRTSRSLFVNYLIPAGLYTLYNFLTFLGLSYFDPATYFVLMQFRIAVTALFSILLLKRTISPTQWMGLLIVMTGAMLKEAKWGWKGSGDIVGYAVVGVQLTLSALAGVLTERLLKSTSGSAGGKLISMNLQNICMYTDSILVNLFASLVQNRFANPASANQVSLPTLSSWILPTAIVLNGVLLGLITAHFLRSLNAILKTIASALELWVTVILSSAVFGYTVDTTTIAGIAIVSLGIYMYSVNGQNQIRQKLKR